MPRKPSSLTLEHVLLALLDAKPMHGYELHQELAQMPGVRLIWTLKQPMLYALLDKLERNGYLTSELVHGETYPARKVYSVTAVGRESLAAWTISPVRRARHLRQEFLAKLIVARKYGVERAQALIQAQIAACQRWQAELEENFPPPERADERLVYSYRLQRVETTLQWLKDTMVKE